MHIALGYRPDSKKVLDGCSVERENSKSIQFNRLLQPADIVKKTSSIMSSHQIETAFLRRIILYDDGEEHRELETSIERVQRHQRCVQRVTYVLAPFPMLAIAGVFYAEILQETFAYNGFGIGLRLLCELGLASLVCLVGLVGLLAVYRLKLNRLRKECFQLVVRLLESHLGKPHISTLPGSHRGVDGREALQAAKSGVPLSADPILRIKTKGRATGASAHVPTTLAERKSV